MPNERNIWYQAGYALERARSRGLLADRPESAEKPEPARVRQGGRKPRSKPRPTPAPRLDEGSLATLADRVMGLATVAGGSVLAGVVLRLWRPRSRPGPLALMKASAAGAGAAVARLAFRALLGAPRDASGKEDPLAPILAGAARGMLYAGVVEPRVPGPVVLRGVTYGAAEYLAEPWGGLEGLIDHVPVHRRVPVLASLLDVKDDGEGLAEHLFFGIVLASLYGEGRDG